jgi:hypothetical protein
VTFARNEPALYWIMYESARDSEDLPKQARSGEATAFVRLRTALAEQGAHLTETEMELTMTAAWCTAHGLASMAGFRQFDHLKSELGGEAAFLQAVLDRLGIYRKALER